MRSRAAFPSEAVKGTKAQAQRRLTELLRELDTGTLPGPSGLTVGKYLCDWLRDYAEVRVRPRTLEGYRDHVRLHISPRIGRVSLERLIPRQVRGMEADLLRSGGPGGRGLSPRTVVQTHRILHNALKNAVKLGLILRNVAHSVEPPRFARYEVRTLTWDEVLRLLEGVEDPLLRMVGLAGLRLHDLRHTHASLMLSEGVHLKVVSERLGHSSIAVTGNIYSHVQPTVQREAVERFGVAWRVGIAKEWQIRDEGTEIP